MHKKLLFDATIEIKGIDRKGMLLDVSKVISDQLGINIHKLTISSDNGIFDGTIELRIHDREEVKIIMDQLKKIEDLQEVQRILMRVTKIKLEVRSWKFSLPASNFSSYLIINNKLKNNEKIILIIFDDVDHVAFGCSQQV